MGIVSLTKAVLVLLPWMKEKNRDNPICCCIVQGAKASTVRVALAVVFVDDNVVNFANVNEPIDGTGGIKKVNN
jgi:hypothetical protein